MPRDTIGRPMEILLVEDSLVDARLAIGALKNGQIKHRLTLILDGEEAMEFLRREGRFARAPRPDLVLLDLHLPLKGGLDVLADIRDDYELRDLPVVILTGSQDEEDKLRCEMLHVDSYMVKPVDFEKFLGVVRKLKTHWHADLILPPLD
jgi:chemotaxis family two-component system response regulator Rcp1